MQDTCGPYDVTGSGGESGPLGSQPQAQAPSSTSFSTKTQPRQDAGLGSSGVSWRHLWDAPLLAATVRWTTRTIGPGNPPDGTGLDARVRRLPRMESYRAVKSRVAGDVCWERQRLPGNSAEASGRPQTAQRARKRRRLEGAEKGEAERSLPPLRGETERDELLGDFVF